MSSGVAVNPECLEVYQNLKLGKKLKYIIFKLSDDNKEITVEKSSNSASYDDFVSDLPASTCRYAIYDFEYEKGNEGKRNKLCFYAWSPDEAKIKTKMLYASSKDALRRALVGISSEIQGTDHSEIAYQEVMAKKSGPYNVPELIGLPAVFSHGNRVPSNATLVYVAGQIHWAEVDGKEELVKGTVEEKLTVIIRNLETILKAGGSSLTQLVKVNIYITDFGFFAEMNEAYKKLVPQPMPPRTCVCVKALPFGADIEIEATGWA